MQEILSWSDYGNKDK